MNSQLQGHILCFENKRNASIQNARNRLGASYIEGVFKKEESVVHDSFFNRHMRPMRYFAGK